MSKLSILGKRYYQTEPDWYKLMSSVWPGLTPGLRADWCSQPS